jgi:hypothetical protein
LTSLPSTLVADLVAGLTAAGYDADSPSTAQAPPSSGFPTCTAGTWNADDCYGPLVPTVSAAPLLSLGTGTLQGYAAADSTGAYARAGTAGVLLSLLGVNVGNLGLADAAAQCLANGTCTATSTLTGLSLLSGTVAAKTAGDGSLLVSIAGGPYVAVSTLSSPVSVSAAGVLSATVQAQSGALRIKVGLGLTDLLAALGIGASLSSVNATDAGSAVTLSLTIGPGTKSSSAAASAWGLDVSVGLDVNVQLSVLGLVTVGLAAPDSATGNLVDLQLAYASAADTDNSPISGAPPALT